MTNPPRAARRKRVLRGIAALLLTLPLLAAPARTQTHWGTETLLNPYRLPPIAPGTKPTFTDLDKDGDPDVMRYVTANGFPVQWIDDDDDMKWTDLEGDTDNDCLMVDRNKDGQYGSWGDIAIDWNDTNGDGRADMQVLTEYAPAEKKNEVSGPGHIMITLDTDHDGIFNYIDYSTFELRAWLHDGASDFYQDYHGKSMFLKAHTSPSKVNDPQLNWENPFLFYDPDGDGLTEMAIRMLDLFEKGDPAEPHPYKLTGNIGYVAITFDADNDNAPGNEFDFDWTINYRGPGFSYRDQIHRFRNMRGLPAADQYFLDPRYRQVDTLRYADHEAAWPLIFDRGKWNTAWFTYDEDDDSQRWERVELYGPMDPYKFGQKAGGLDDNGQADPAGDRADWDLDFSGGGNLYVSPLDGKLHLLGAEKGAWRIDQNAESFQGMGGLYDVYGPARQAKPVTRAALIRYADRDGNGFLDTIEYDLDGDGKAERSISAKALGLTDTAPVLKMRDLNYQAVTRLETANADAMWARATGALAAARRLGINTDWYALMQHPKSVRQRQHHGYWLQFYIYRDLLDRAARRRDAKLTLAADRAFHGGGWDAVGR